MTTPSADACARCEELERQIAQLREALAQAQAAIAELQNQLDEASRKGKRQAAPFRRSASQKKPAGEKKPPGRKPGHPRAARPAPEQVDRTIPVPAEVCPDCGVGLVDKTTHVQYQTDIPPVTPLVTQFHVEVGFCPCCGRRVQGTHPEQTSQALGAAAHTLGPRAVAFAADFKYRLGLPFRKTADLFGRAFGLECCAGALSRATARLADAGRGLVEVLKLQLRGRRVVHADETSWWIGGEKAWLHVLAADDLVLFQVGDRSAQIALDLLGPDFPGVVCCDGYAGYDLFETARCNAHPIRRVRDLLEASRGDRAALEAIQALLFEGLALRDRREDLTDLGYRRLVTLHTSRVATWIEAHREHPDEAVGRLARHLGRYEQEFLRYLNDPTVPATNNVAEGLLRSAVLLRKIGCANRTPRGVKTFEILSSLLATFRRRNRDFVDWAMELLHGVSPKYVPPEFLPPGFPFQIALQ